VAVRNQGVAEGKIGEGDSIANHFSGFAETGQAPRELIGYGE